MAVNEYGAPLDRNGYAASILQSSYKCFICEIEDRLQRHEPFGNFNRQKSKNYGMWVLLCWRCHDGVTNRSKKIVNGCSYQQWELDLRKVAEATARADYGWTHEEFIRRFGKSAKGEKL